MLPILVAVSSMRTLFFAPQDVPVSSAEWERAKQLFAQKNQLPKSDFELLEINRMDSNELVESGLSPKQASAALRYRNSISGFADVQELYSCQYIPEYWIEENLERISFSGAKIPRQHAFESQWDHDTTVFFRHENTSGQKMSKPMIVDINLADSAQLEQLPGIGAGMAGRIIKYRERLGGFLTTNQLFELYGMKMDNYLKFKDLVIIEENFRPKFICINTCTKDELANHPYIQRRLANSLINIREQHGPYHEMEGLKFSALMNDSIYELIRPYISICAGSSTRDP
jgi:DNA uptake protein ComE-like DNA-binding protein